VALFDRSERSHRRVSSLWSSDATAAATSDYVFDETVTVLKVRVGHKASVAAGQAMLDSPRVSIEPISDEDRRSAWAIFSTHGDRRWSFTDCTSKVLIDRLGFEQVWALDIDFRQMGYEVRP
jgi:uncharacterized protein